jgi:hydroxyacyl-ACP dehydratase HTD2-like protein with hotdog domain
MGDPVVHVNDQHPIPRVGVVSKIATRRSSVQPIPTEPGAPAVVQMETIVTIKTPNVPSRGEVVVQEDQAVVYRRATPDEVRATIESGQLPSPPFISED